MQKKRNNYKNNQNTRNHGSPYISSHKINKKKKFQKTMQWVRD